MTISDNPILTCELCGKHIDNLTWGMLFWNRVEEPAGGVTDLCLAHKDCMKNDNDDSCELFWFGEASCALYRVASMSVRYEFTIEQLQKIVLIAYAVAKTATPADKKSAVQVAQWL